VSVTNGSLFIVSTSAEEFFSFACGLTFLIKGYDGMLSNETIVKLKVPLADLLNIMTGDCDGSNDMFRLQRLDDLLIVIELLIITNNTNPIRISLSQEHSRAETSS
jgi:hypothetical protein